MGDFMKEAILHIDLDSILYNYRHLKCFYKKNVIAVLKDNAYGLGLIEIAKTLENEDGLIIAINHLNEAKLLRENNFAKDILYLNVFDENDLDFIKKYNISVILNSLDQLKLLKNSLIPFHIKFNTGMNRLGLNEIDAIKAIKILNSKPKNYNLVGALTHIPTDDKDHAFYYKFEKLVKMLNYKNLIIHCHASNSLNEYFDNITNYIRVGLKLYGIGERSTFLHLALTLKAPILDIKTIKKNEQVGYDLSYTTSSDGYLYILPIGYGQGLPRFNDSIVYTNYAFLKQAGKISMDYSTFFSNSYFDLNNEIEIFGHNVPIESLALLNKIDPHEIIVNLKTKKQYHKLTIKNK